MPQYLCCLQVVAIVIKLIPGCSLQLIKEVSGYSGTEGHTDYNSSLMFRIYHGYNGDLSTISNRSGM